MQKRHSHQTRCDRGSLWLLPYADTLGIFASIACLIHCLALPALLFLAPAFSRFAVHDDRTHVFLAAFVVSFCLLGILPGYLRHAQKKVLMMMLGGLSLVLFATFSSALLLGETWEIPLITVGNLLVVAAHYNNRKLLSCSH
jgi:hypothetical protein